MTTKAAPSVALALRSLLWTVLLPGVFSGYLPWRFFGLDRARIDWSDPTHMAGWFVCVNLFVMGYEEPTLRDQFGESYDEYTRRVPRWIPKIRRG